MIDRQLYRRTARRNGAASGPLVRIGASSLYAPPGGETWVFLLWDDAAPPATIAIDETWADHGSPQRIGDYVFTLSVPAAPGAGAFEAMLRGVFSPPMGATGFGGAGKSAPGATPVAVKLISDQPIVAEATPVNLPRGVLTFGFMASLSLLATRDDSGAMTGLIATTPAPDSAAPVEGIALPLLGSLAGCIEFRGALRSAVDGDSSIKRLAQVRIDPLRVSDPKSTRVSPLPF